MINNNQLPKPLRRGGKALFARGTVERFVQREIGPQLLKSSDDRAALLLSHCSPLLALLAVVGITSVAVHCAIIRASASNDRVWSAF